MTVEVSAETTMEFIDKAEKETRPGGIVISANKVEFGQRAKYWLVVEKDNVDDPGAFNSLHLSLYIEDEYGSIKYERQFCSGDEASLSVVLEQKLREYKREAEQKRSELHQKELEACRLFLYRAASENARIVSTNDLLDIQIVQARQDGRMIVLQDGLGFVLLPFEISTPKDKSREQQLLQVSSVTSDGESSATMSVTENDDVGEEIANEEIVREIQEEEILAELRADENAEIAREIQAEDELS